MHSLRGHAAQPFQDAFSAVHRSRAPSQTEQLYYSLCLGVASCVCLTRSYPQRYSTHSGRLRRKLMRRAFSTTNDEIGVRDDADYIEQKLHELRSLRARDLKLHLQWLKVDTKSCLDKESLLELLDTEGRRALKAAQPPQDTRSRISGRTAKLEELPKEVQERVAALQNVGASDLKSELTSLGLRTDNCVDKEELIELLLRDGLIAIEHDMVLQRIGRHAAEAQPLPADYSSPFPWRKPVGRSKRATCKVYNPLGVAQYGLKAAQTVAIEVGIGQTDNRFIVDTVAQASRIKPEIAHMMRARDQGVPSWMDPFTVAKYDIRNVIFDQMGWINEVHACNPTTGFRFTTLPYRFPMPPGICGTFGMEYLKRMDWDFSFPKFVCDVSVTPKREPLRSQKPVPFNLVGMQVVPVFTVQLPVPLLACLVDLRDANGGGDWLYVTGIIDLAAPCTMCNRVAAKRLGIDTDNGADELHKTFRVDLLMGDGPDGPVKRSVDAVVGVDNDIKRFEELGLADDWPTVLLGPDVLCRSRLIFSPRLQSLWLPASRRGDSC